MSEHLVYVIVLGACVCGVVIALGVLEYVLWLSEQQERRQG